MNICYFLLKKNSIVVIKNMNHLSIFSRNRVDSLLKHIKLLVRSIFEVASCRVRRCLFLTRSILSSSGTRLVIYFLENEHFKKIFYFLKKIFYSFFSTLVTLSRQRVCIKKIYYYRKYNYCRVVKKKKI